ncbi:GntR family transcriptional regulator [Allopusillimonas soli]|uniref:GntR family transcriptional regulator n=1 Tax=Allopusillimonas soli TaxID=659016 RepID=A0A853FAN0_9BURK|nr:GntR family transcriptional regulator [Allopusillimonas soli]NYT36838.1 GntR family transcriptional regulator [Allopusillimonas soli]TEA75300.1 GntR family transcriptional regulator [Allopusillimonas soli]
MNEPLPNRFLSLPDQIVAKLTDDIVTGVYRPGERLKEQEIALSIGISRAPLREAFRILERKGLIEILPWKGARVVEPTRTEIDELFDARADLFGLCARHVAKSGSPNDIAAIQAEIKSLIAATDAGCDEKAYKRQTNHIYMMMYNSIDNRYLRDIMDNIRQKMFWHYCYLGTSTIERRLDSNKYWRELSTAIEQHDAQAAEQAAQSIMIASKEFALQLLDHPLQKL